MGYYVEKGFDNRHFIAYPIIPAEQGVVLTLEESQLLQELLHTQHQHPLSKNLMQADNAKKIRQLSEAITQKRQVILKNYHSAHTQSISDRLVEPQLFSENYESITAYEIKSQKVKAFKKIDRIQEVEPLNRIQTQGNRKTNGSQEGE